MRHRKQGRKLGVTQSHRKRLLQGLVNALFLHERIITTVTRAKEARRMAEKLITLAKHTHPALLARYRQALSTLQDKVIVKKLFREIAPRFADRPGGYTRVVKLGGCRWTDESKYAMTRLGDAGPRCIFELVVRAEPTKAEPGKKGAKAAKPAKAAKTPKAPKAEKAAKPAKEKKAGAK